MISNSKERQLYISFGICLLFVLPFILNDLQYRDDWYRTVGFIDGWAINGRHLSNYLLNLVTLKFHGVSDLSPLPAVLATCLAAWSIVYAFRCSSYNHNPLFLIAFTCLFVSPFYIQNIAYKYDILPMTASVSLALLAIILPSVNNTNTRNIAAIVMISAAFSLYQVGNNIFIGLCAVNMIYGLWGNKSRELKYPLHMALLYIAGFLLYSFITYTILDAKVDRTDTGDLYTFVNAFHNAYLYGIKGFFIAESKPFILIMLTSFVAHFCYMLLKREGITQKMVLIAGVATLLFSILGIVSLLREGYTSLRVLIGGNALYFSLVLSSFVLLERIKYSKIFLPVLCLICPMVFSYALASAMKIQRNYEITIINSIYSNMDSKNINGKYKAMYVAGPMPLSPVAWKFGEHYKAISYYISPSYPWVSRWMLSYYGIDKVSLSPGGDPDWIMKKISDRKIKPVMQARRYAIYLVDGDGLLWFK